MAKKKIPRIIKFYQYEVGNNRFVGNDNLGAYDDTAVPKWYAIQAGLMTESRQLADRNAPLGAGGKEPAEGGETFAEDEETPGEDMGQDVQ